MCRFKMANIEKRFKTIWSTCQETSFSGSTAKTTRCKYPQIFDQMKVKKGCLTYSRLDDESSPTLCVRYGVGACFLCELKLKNCREAMLWTIVSFTLPKVTAIGTDGWKIIMFCKESSWWGISLVERKF